MQKREQSKQGGASAVAATPAAKRGRPFGSGSNTAASVAAGVAGDSAAPSTLLGPSLQVHSAFAEQNSKRIVLALQSGLRSELTWALNALTLLSFKEKDEVRKDATPLAKIPGVVEALLQIIDDWLGLTQPNALKKTSRLNLHGKNFSGIGFENELKTLGSGDSLMHPGAESDSLNKEVFSQKISAKSSSSVWWLEEDDLFNLDEEGRAEKQLCAVSASNIIRNFSFMADNEIHMSQNRHCLETMLQCLEYSVTEDEELVTNSLETIMNLGPLIDLRTFSPAKPFVMSPERAFQSIIGMLGSPVKTWHCSAAELLGRLVLNPDNENFFPSFAPQIYKRLVEMLSLPSTDAQAAAIGALYNFVEINSDCRLKLATERWAVDRLLKLIRAPHPVPEICRKATLILENLVLEPQNKPLLMAYENVFADMLFSDSRYSDTFSRILFELTSRPSHRVTSAHGIWGM